MNRSVAINLLAVLSILFIAVADSSATAGSRYFGPPSFTAPSSGSTVDGQANFTGNAWRGTKAVALSVDGGSWSFASGTTTWSASIDTVRLANGSHTVTAQATSNSGATATSSVSIVVSNQAPDTTPPSVTIASPASGATVSGAVSVKGSAADDVGVAAIAVAVDNASFAAAQGTTGWSYSIDTTALPSGSHTLTVRATDAAGNVGTAQLTVGVGSPAATTLTNAPEWTAGMEGGRLSEWTDSSGGGEYDSGAGQSVASTDLAHTGSWSAKQTIDTTAGSSGTRLFRWAEFRTLTPGQAATVSAWVYLPQPVKVGGYFNLFQFKSKTQDGKYIDVFFQLNIRSRTDGSMYLNAAWGCGAENPSFPNGPYRSSTSLCDFFTPLANVDFPAQRWVKLTAQIVPSSSYAGSLRFWQDDTLLYDVTDAMTGYPNTNSVNGVDTQWAINAYGNGLTPSAFTQYVDDVSITPLP